MTESTKRLATTVARLLAIVALMTASYSAVAAQTPRPVTSPLDADKSAEETPPFTSLAEEMRSRRAISFAEKEYRDNLDRARNLSFLGTVINTAFKQKKSLDPEDLKKLEKAEKLAKGIRNAAGGSEDKVKIEKPPKDLATALGMFEDLAESLKSKVEKTPKRVVSAAVIDEANVLLEVIRIVRAFPPKA
ncbi:MAG: hypothetical protein ABR556_02240 [Pyrinomonadaceae bacterium]